MSKGSKQRLQQVSNRTLDANWDAAFSDEADRHRYAFCIECFEHHDGPCKKVTPKQEKDLGEQIERLKRENKHLFEMTEELGRQNAELRK